MIRQLPLGISPRESARLSSFHAGDNAQALAAVSACVAGQGEPFVYLWGAANTGKSHLLQGASRLASERGLAVAYLPLAEYRHFAPEILHDLEAIQLVCLDDVHRVAGQRAWEQALFHLFNQLRDHGGRLLASADSSPQNLPVSLPDLGSRLGWGPVYQLRPLTDQQKIEALTKHAARRGLDLPADSARYILHHAVRDMASLVRILERLDQASLAAQRRLTVPFIKTVLKE